MTKKEFGYIAKIMKTAWTNDNFLSTKEALELWFKKLEKYNGSLVLSAVNDLISESIYPPTIAAIEQKVIPLDEMRKNVKELYYSVGEGERYEQLQKGVAASFDLEGQTNNKKELVANC